MRFSRATFPSRHCGNNFDAHRLMIELRAAQKLNAGLFDSNESVLVGADDI
jgi:hypothetical protein